MVLGDGTRVLSMGVCRDVPVSVAEHTFHITCYVFPLCSMDMILGVSWLATLGDVMANWSSLTMHFVVDGRLLSIRGEPSLTRRACGRGDLRTLEGDDEFWMLLAVADIKGVSTP